MYGGYKREADETVDEVYVLSLPGFVFFKSSNPSTTRADHACALIGRRQMLSVGGTDGDLGYPGSLRDPDPWENGLGVLDLTTMAWTNRFDPAASEYDSPSNVKEWYAQGGLASMTWDSKEVQQLFDKKPPPGSGSNPDPSSPSPTAPSDPSTGDPSDTLTGGSSPPIGAIVGGVVGGVVLIAVVVIAAFFVRRKRRVDETATQTAVGTESSGWDPNKNAYVDQWSVGVAAYGEPPLPPQELDGHTPTELPAQHGMSEVSGPHGWSELPQPEYGSGTGPGPRS